MRKSLFVLVQVVLCQLILPTVAVAEEAAKATQQAQTAVHENAPLTSDTYRLKDEMPSGSVSASPDPSEVVFGLIAVLGLIVVAAWAAKRFNLNGMSIGQTLKLQSVLSLGSKEKIVVVEVEGKKLLLGVTSQNVNLLCHLEDTVQQDAENKNNTADSNKDIGSFAQQIKKALAQGKLSEDSKAS